MAENKDRSSLTIEITNLTEEEATELKRQILDTLEKKKYSSDMEYFVETFSTSENRRSTEWQSFARPVL